MDDHGERIRRFDFFDHTEAAAFWRFVCGIKDEIESGFYVGGSEWATVVKFYVGLEMKNVSLLDRVFAMIRPGRRGDSFGRRGLVLCPLSN